jgi:[acyl-carrier-protein] S-malonyltransferase
MRRVIEAGAQHIVECGPGKVLSGLSRRIEKTLHCYSLEEPEALLTTAAELK